MPTTLRQTLDIAQSFLKDYVIWHQAHLDENVYEGLKLAVTNAKKNALSVEIINTEIIVDFVLDLLLLIHGETSQVANDSLLGSRDIKTIEMLGEVAVFAAICPLLQEYSKLPNHSTMTEMAKMPKASRLHVRTTIQKILPLILAQSYAFASFKRPINLGIVLAGAVDISYNPAIDCQTTFCDSIISCIPPQQLIPALQTLLVRPNPTWAQSQYKAALTAVFTRPDGLLQVSTFMLDSGDSSIVERINHLSRLVIAIPSRIDIATYMETLAPQVITLFDRSGSDDRYRRAAVKILQLLSSAHEQYMSSIVESFWHGLLDVAWPAVDFKDPVIQKCMQRLSDLSAFADLRHKFFASYVNLMFCGAYTAHATGQLTIRDHFQRLLHRLVETSLSISIIPGLDAITQLELPDNYAATKIANDSALSHQTSFFLDVLDYLKMNGQPILVLQENLLITYGKLQDPKLQSEYLKIMLLLPTKYMSAFKDEYFAGKFQSHACQHYQVIISQRKETVDLDDLSLVYAHMLRLYADDLVITSEAQFQVQERLVSTLQALARKTLNDHFRQSLEEIQARYELRIAKWKSSQLVKENDGVSQDHVTCTATGDRQAQRYLAALADLQDDMVPNRAHGLYLVGELAKEKAPEEIMQLPRLTPTIIGLLAEEDAFVHQNAIKCIRKLIAAYGTAFTESLDKVLTSTTTSEVVKCRLEEAMVAP